MLALIYLALGIALGDLVSRRYYRFVSVPHRWAAAILVGMLFSTWFTYLAGLGFAHTSEPLLFADLLFFAAAPGAIWWLSRKAPKASAIAPRAPGSSTWDWITLGALFASAYVLLIGTLSVNKQGALRLCAKETGDFARQLSIAQSVALGRSFPDAFPEHVSQSTQFLFFFQAGNLQFLGLNLAWSVDVLYALALISMLVLVTTLGELLFKSRIVGRLGATLVLFYGSLRHLSDFLASGTSDRDETWGFWRPLVFLNQRYLPFAIGTLLLVLIFLVDRYRQRRTEATRPSEANIALREPKRRTNWNLNKGFASTFITRAKALLTPSESLVFSGLLLAALPLWNVSLFMATIVVLCCLLLTYGSWWSSRVKGVAMLGRVLAGMLTACILAAGVVELWAFHNDSCIEVGPDKEPLVKGLTFRNSVTYKIPDFGQPSLARSDSSRLPATTFGGGHGNGRGEFDSPQAIATDSVGNIFVADTGNGRIEKFSADGTFLTSIGQFEAPNGIAIDRAGNIYVAEIGSKHRIQKIAPDGNFITAWAPALYGPRRIAIGPDNSIYVVDSGRNRIVKFNPNGEVVATWGRAGSGDGQFIDLSSVVVDRANGRVYVADPINHRIQVFDSSGTFLTKWLVPEWGQSLGFEDVAVDVERARLYASSSHRNSIFVFGLQGNGIGTITPTPPDKLADPSGLALTKDKLLVLNTGSARVSVIPLPAR